jgi:predicted NAD/FAD-binding protein
MRTAVVGSGVAGLGAADLLSRAHDVEVFDEVRALGYDDHFVRTWNFYLASCEAGFRIRALRDAQIVLER